MCVDVVAGGRMDWMNGKSRSIPYHPWKKGLVEENILKPLYSRESRTLLE